MYVDNGFIFRQPSLVATIQTNNLKSNATLHNNKTHEHGLQKAKGHSTVTSITIEKKFSECRLMLPFLEPDHMMELGEYLISKIPRGRKNEV